MPIRGILFIFLIALLIWLVFGGRIYESFHSYFHKDDQNDENDPDK